ncbi:hypothetical protein CEXT_683441 [Caerostris extrusa]|uniref:Uncharacterized protein n=1 Tax=Caerostris extrusa TaxID=172846 RepID=A0AAV4QBV6_CAEEX|nr:hypothetical protein CEXT_683441 [Caerostris extrusa]
MMLGSKGNKICRRKQLIGPKTRENLSLTFLLHSKLFLLPFGSSWEGFPPPRKRFRTISVARPHALPCHRRSTCTKEFYLPWVKHEKIKVASGSS